MPANNVDFSKLVQPLGSEVYNKASRSGKGKIAKSRKKEAERIRHLWQMSNNGKRQQWQTKEQKAYDFALNSQLTQEEEDDLKFAGMPTFIINRMTPVLETMKYFVTANNPRWKAVGAQGADVDLAQIHTDIIDYCWYIYSGKSMFGQVVADALMKSKGYFHIYVDPSAERGMGEVMLERVDPFHVWVSSMTSDFLEKDATYHIIKKDLPKHELYNKLPEYKDKIAIASGNMEGEGYTDRDLEESDSIQPAEVETSLDPEGREDEVVQYYEEYRPIRVRYYNLFIKREVSESELGEARDFIDDQINKLREELSVRMIEKEGSLRDGLERGDIVRERYELEVGKSIEEIESSVQEQRNILIAKAKEESSKIEQKYVTEEEYEELKKLGENIVVDAIPYYDRKIQKTCVVGDQWLYSYILNISYAPLIPIPYMHTGTPFPMSAALPLIGKQQEINKSHQIMVHNANLGSNIRWTYLEGSIDEDLWEDYSASPGALLPYRTPGERPEPIMPQAIASAFYTIEQDSKSDLEYMAGIQPPSMGVSSERDETYRGFLAKDEYGTRRIRSWISNTVEPALEHIGKVFMEMAQDTYTFHKIFRIVQPNPSGSFDTREIEINVPLYDDSGDEIGRFNDYASSRYDIRIIAGSTLPVNRWAVLEEYKQYLELGVIDDIAFIAETDIRNKEQILRRKSILVQLKQQNEALQDAVKERDGTIETLSRQLVQAGIKSKVDDARVELDRSKTELKMSDKLLQERIRDSLKEARKDMERELDKLRDEIKNKINTKNKKKNT